MILLEIARVMIGISLFLGQHVFIRRPHLSQEAKPRERQGYESVEIKTTILQASVNLQDFRLK